MGTTIAVDKETKDKIDKCFFIIKTNIIQRNVSEGREFTRDKYLNAVFDEKNIVGGSLICQTTF